jgi:hypothetical protein
MAVLIRYQPSSLTRDQYDQVNAKLAEASGSSEMPPPMLLHVLFGEEPKLRVSEIWTSEDEWRGAWEGMLGQALSAAGVEFSTDPEILTVHELEGSAVTVSR